MFLLIAIATIWAIGIGIVISTQSAQAQRFGDRDDSHGQSFHDANGEVRMLFPLVNQLEIHIKSLTAAEIHTASH